MVASSCTSIALMDEAVRGEKLDSDTRLNQLEDMLTNLEWAAVGQVVEGKPDSYLQSLPKPRYGKLHPTLLRPDEEPASWWVRGGGYTPMVPPGYISPSEVERNWRMRRYDRTQPPHLKGCDNDALICEGECPLKPHNQGDGPLSLKRYCGVGRAGPENPT